MSKGIKQEVSPEFIAALSECANAAYHIGELEYEYEAEYKLAVEYQQRVWLPRVKIIFIVGIILAGVLGVLVTKVFLNEVSSNAVLGFMMGVQFGLPVVFIGIIVNFVFLQLKGQHQKSVVELEKEMSRIAKEQWIPNKKAADKMARNMAIDAYREEYNNLSAIDKHIKNKTIAKIVKNAYKEELKRLIPTKEDLAMGLLIGGVVCGGLLKMVGSASADFGRPSGTKTIERIEYENGDVKYREL